MTIKCHKLYKNINQIEYRNRMEAVKMQIFNFSLKSMIVYKFNKSATIIVTTVYFDVF